MEQRLNAQGVVRIDLPDRVRLPLRLDARALEADLRRLGRDDWIDHMAPQNYDGAWRIVPLRAAAGETHPVRMITSDARAREFTDTLWLDRLPAHRAALARFQCPLCSVRLMRLAPGSRINEHRDPDLDAKQGWARLHVPIETDEGVEFLLNRRPVPMEAGSVWYLRLLDPHSVANRSSRDRTHLVIDARVDDWLANLLRRGGG